MLVAAAGSVSQAHVTVSAFDVHLWSKPFDTSLFNPKIHFLWSAPKYREMRDAGERLELDNLVLFPLKDELSRERNHFWYRYSVAVDTLPPSSETPLGDTRDFLWPLRCRPKNFKLSFVASKAKTPPNVWATIWLWPFGWSSTIEFKVTSRFSLDDLQDLGVKLRSTAPAPFVLDGKPMSLAAVFRRLSDMVRQDAAIPGHTLDDVTHLARHVVYSLEFPAGMSMPANAFGWPAADQQRMLGALRGSRVPLGQLINTEVLFTALGDRNFAVTDFNEGTLLLLRHWKDRAGTKRETNHCLFANVRAFSVVHFMLHRFIQYAKSRPALGAVVKNATMLLSSLPNEYRNGLALNFGKYYSRPSENARAIP